MSDDNTTPEGTEPNGGEPDFTPITSQDEFDKRLSRRLERERAKYADYDVLREKAEKFDQAQQASKTDIEKATERATTAETTAAAETLRADRAEVALTKGLTLTQAKRLVGTTREELEADADELLADLGNQAPKAPRAPQQKTNQTTAKDDPEREFARKLFGRSD